jgi:hypothetical protein
MRMRAYHVPFGGAIFLYGLYSEIIMIILNK